MKILLEFEIDDPPPGTESIAVVGNKIYAILGEDKTLLGTITEKDVSKQSEIAVNRVFDAFKPDMVINVPILVDGKPLKRGNWKSADPAENGHHQFQELDANSQPCNRFIDIGLPPLGSAGARTVVGSEKCKVLLAVPQKRGGQWFWVTHLKKEQS
jgi:hypothetical protein